MSKPVLQDQLQRYVAQSEAIRNQLVAAEQENLYLRRLLARIDTVRIAMQPSWSLPVLLAVEWHPSDGRPQTETGFYQEPQEQEPTDE